MTTKQLTISVGQYSDKGRKKINQDFHGVFIPQEPQLTSKGIAVALADGISSSQVAHVASQATITGFLADYYCTSDAWSVKKSAHQVLAATNSWLYSQTQQGQYRFNKDKGYVCTLSAMIIKSNRAHIFHVGDTRVCRLHEKDLEQLTEDHRLWVSREKSYLSRAMGIHPRLDIDYKTLPISPGDVFLLMTDGVYEFVSDEAIVKMLAESGDSLDDTARKIVETAYREESDDNLTLQIVRIDEVPDPSAEEIYQSLTELPFPPVLEPRKPFDGYQIIRNLHASSRSHVYLALDEEGQQVVIKTPSTDIKDDPGYLERFLLEEWIAQRINSVHVLRPYQIKRRRNFIYTVTEYIEGQTLAQWVRDNPKPKLEAVRAIIEQVAKGLRAFHRLEMVHQDIRPENIMIDSQGTVKIIDFGATRVAGVAEISANLQQEAVLGTAQFTAPEYWLGETGSPRSDLYSLGVLTYQMLTGKFPYGVKGARAKTRAAQNKLNYIPMTTYNPDIPVWIDDAVKKAVQGDPLKRYQECSEFVYDLRHPNKEFLHKTRPPLIERDPVKFWKGLVLLETLIIIALLVQ